MSGIPLEALQQFAGLGAAMPAGREDPVACEKLRQAVEQYGMWSKQPDSPDSIAERAKYKKQWDNLKAQRACRPKVATSAQAAADAAAARAAAEYRQQNYQQPVPSAPVTLPTFSLPQRGAFGFKPKEGPITDLFFRQEPAMATTGSIPPWAWALAGVATTVLLGSAALKARSRAKAKAARS